MQTFIVCCLYMLYIVDCLPAKTKGVDFWSTFPKVVPIQATPTQTLNLTLDEFRVLAEQNRVTHNSILPSAKANFTLFPWNTLLFGNSSIPRDENDDIFGESTWPQYLKGEFSNMSCIPVNELNSQRPLGSVIINSLVP